MRTFEQIYGEINEAQKSETALSELNSTSQTSIWGTIKRMFALVFRLFEARIETYQAQILALIDAQEKGDLYYYVKFAKLFQYGDAFQITRFGVSYPTVNLNNQIIAQASANEVTDSYGSKVLLKVAKNSSAGLVKLATGEVTALTDYINAVKFAGVRVEIRSNDPEVLTLNLTVNLNKAVCNTNGSLISNNTFFPVVENIKAFIQNLPFDSTFRWRDLESSLMTLEAVTDCSITSSLVGSTGFVMSTISESGYFTLSNDSVITYV
jgi:hypothetical protein